VRGNDGGLAGDVARFSALRFAENLFHLLPLGEFIHEFVEVADLPRERVLDVFDSVAADDALDQVRVGVDLRVPEEFFEG